MVFNQRRDPPRLEAVDVFDDDVPIKEVEHLDEGILRVRLSRALPVSPYHRHLLERGADAATLLPEAPNRAGVAYNLEQARRRLSEGFASQRGCPLLREAGVDDEVSFLRFNLSHFSEPDWLYTNAQGVVSVVERPGQVEAIPHVFPFSSLKRYLVFGSEYSTEGPAQARQGARFASLSVAETWIGMQLARVQVSPLPVQKGAERGMAFLQVAGERRGERGYSILTYLLHDRSGSRKERVLPGESYRFLNELDLEGFRARTCATCAHFAFSGMSWDMSNGETGYCGRRSPDPPDGLTGIFDTCPRHDFVEDAGRAHPYLPRGDARR